jgi:uncharacterized membrane protein
MDLTLLHPKLVHMPIALAVLMPVLSFALLIAWWRDALPRRAWMLAIGLQGALVLSSVAAMQTGEHDEEMVERVVAEAHIEAHEEAAELFLWASVAVLGVALGAGLIRKERLALSLATAASLGTLVVFGLGYRVGDAGGRLVYEHGAANAFIDGTTGGAPVASYEREEDDD